MEWFNKWILPLLSGLALFGFVSIVDSKDWIFNLLFAITVTLTGYVITQVIK